MSVIRKKCIRCEIERGIDDFLVDSRNLDGHANTCKPCRALESRVKRKTGTTNKRDTELILTCSVCSTAQPTENFRWNSRTGYKTECLTCEKTILRCTRCKEIKPHERFPATNVGIGLHGVCLDCRAAEGKNKYRNDPESRKKHKTYAHTERAKSWRKQHWQKVKDSPVRKANRREYMRWLYHADPIYRLKVKARSMVRQSLQNGLLIKPEGCECCGEITTELEAHHYAGYWPRSTWLMIEWLCKDCHVQADATQPKDKLFIGFDLPELIETKVKVENAGTILGLDQQAILTATTQCLGEDECDVFLNVINWLDSNGYKIAKSCSAEQEVSV